MLKLGTDPANIRLGQDVLKTSWRRLEDVFSVTFFCLPRRLENVLKTSWRHNCKTSCKHVWKTSWRRLEDVLKTPWKTSWRRLEDVLGRRIANTSWRRLEDVLEDEKCYAEDVLENKKCLLGSYSKTIKNRNVKLLRFAFFVEAIISL